MSRYCLCLAIIFLIAACEAEAIPTPTAEPPVRVATTASAQSFLRGATDRALTGMTPFLITAASQLEILNRAAQEPIIGVTLYLPEGTTLWATPLGVEPIVVIANPNNPAIELSLGQLQAIYTGRDTTWVAAAREEGDDSRLFFELAALQGLQPAATLRVAPSPQAMLDFVSSTPNGLGYLPLHWVNEANAVRIMSIDGKQPNDEAYALRTWVVAVAKQEPTGPAREWLGRVQSEK